MDWLLPSRIWLSGNVTWEIVAQSKNYPQPVHLVYTIPIALAFVVIRFVFTRLLFIPIGQYFGIKFKTAKPVLPVAALEAAFRSNPKKKNDQLAAEVSWTVREVEIWFRQRKKLNTFTQMTKFTESMWRLVYHFGAVTCGVVFFWKEPWLLDSTLFYAKPPLETVVTPEMRWYYCVQLGHCISLIINQFNDVKRKDFRMMFIHHIYYAVLMSVSWIVNSVHIGIAVLLIHDLTDVPLEATKCSIYTKKKTAQSVCFITFSLLWIFFRLMYFPFLIFTLAKDAYPFIAFLPYLLLVGFLLGMQLLHVIWSKMILDMFLASLKTKEFSDVRSESEDNTSTDDEKNK